MSAEMRNLLEKLVARASRLIGGFVEVRIEERRTTTIEMRDGVVTTSYGIDRGAAVRVYIDGSIGFAYTTRLSFDALDSALRRALSMARAVHGKLPKPLEMGSMDAYHVTPVKRSIEDVSIDAKIGDVVELDKLLAKGAKSRTIVYREAVEEKLYASTEDRYLGERRELAYLYVSVYAEEAGVRASAHINNGTISGYMLWKKMSQQEVADKLLSRLRAQLHAKAPKAGNFPVVLAPEALGVFVHEAFGHLAEADLVVAGSVLRGKKGQQVASPLVTIVDDPGIEDGFGTIRFDDEGVKTARAVIVEKGIHKQVMTDRLHATMLGEPPTGNARAESYRYQPLVRMRNTVMLPGEHSVDEVFEGIKFGYYVVSTGGGQTNLDGSFQVGIEEAYEIVNGEIGSPVRGLSIAGNTLDTLRKIDRVAKDFKLFYGHCGKGQVVPVSDGGPHVRVSSMTVGGSA